MFFMSSIIFRNFDVFESSNAIVLNGNDQSQFTICTLNETTISIGLFWIILISFQLNFIVLNQLSKIGDRSEIKSWKYHYLFFSFSFFFLTLKQSQVNNAINPINT